MFKVIISNIEIAHNNSATDCSIAFRYGTEFLASQTIHCKRSRSQDQRSRSQRKVMYQQQKCYNTAMDRFSDFQLGMAS